MLLMPKIYIQESDKFCCYFETEADFEKEWGLPHNSDFDGGVEVEISEELLDKYRRITKEYDEMQSFLSQTMEAYYEEDWIL